MHHLSMAGRRPTFSTFAMLPFFISNRMGGSLTRQESVHKLRHAGVVTHHQDRVLTAVAAKQFLELLVSSLGPQRGVGNDLLFIPDLVGHNRRSLRGPPQWTGDDGIHGHIQRRKRTSHIVGLLDAQLVQSPFFILGGI